MNYKLVPMDRSHLPQVCAIERACFAKPWSEQIFAEELFHDTVSLVVAEGEDGTVLGYGELGVVLDEGCLEKIAVADAWRRQGVAEAILSAFIRFGRANLAFLTLEVRESNLGARNLYDSYGFRQEAVRKGYYHNPAEDAIIMWNRRI